MKKYKLKKEKNTAAGAIKSLFEKMPQEIYSHPSIVLRCDGYVQIENCKEILLYNENSITLNMGKINVEIEGSELEMCSLSKGFIDISGKIFGIKYIYKE